MAAPDRRTFELVALMMLLGGIVMNHAHLWAERTVNTAPEGSLRQKTAKIMVVSLH